MTRNPDDRREDIEELFEQLEELFGSDLDQFHDLVEQVREQIERGEIQPGHPFVTGFTVRMGPDGDPVVDPFGDTPPSGDAGVDIDPDAGAREPVTDIIEGPDTISVTVEIPGIERDDIELTVNPFRAEIHVDGEQRRYFKTVELPTRVDPDTTEATYRNGVLDIEITKAGTGAGRRIDID